ncbi:hypothetical protein EYF80_014424 [Liparis tanakae]|uniref:Uncharacterized protein n=1 Tax=Liparis tanakae TaxID=230148 RepID=A0A4Z2IBM1_9TELE|nr:hypothetical protein EYF80_014424 [Liparis tanakae]
MLPSGLKGDVAVMYQVSCTQVHWIASATLGFPYSSTPVRRADLRSAHRPLIEKKEAFFRGFGETPGGHCGEGLLKQDSSAVAKLQKKPGDSDEGHKPSNSEKDLFKAVLFQEISDITLCTYQVSSLRDEAGLPSDAETGECAGGFSRA